MLRSLQIAGVVHACADCCRQSLRHVLVICVLTVVVTDFGAEFASCRTEDAAIAEQRQVTQCVCVQRSVCEMRSV